MSTRDSESEVSVGIRSILGHSWAYSTWVKMASLNRGKCWEILRDVAGRFPNAKVLDIGCGTGRVLSLLPKGVDYWGYDHNSNYIETARKKFKQRGRFFCGDVETIPESERNFNIVSAFGVLHHLNDQKCQRLIEIAHSCLAPGGYLVTADVTFCDNQPVLARWVVSCDRGQHVRRPEGYQNLAQSRFGKIENTLFHRRGPVPASVCTLVCQRT